MDHPVLRELQGLSTLNDLLLWAADPGRTASIVDLVALDEYTHDLILHVEGELFAVFDTT